MDVGVNISEYHEAEMKEVLSQHFETFSSSDEDLGFCQEIEHWIYSSGDQPIRMAHRRVPPY